MTFQLLREALGGAPEVVAEVLTDTAGQFVTDLAADARVGLVARGSG